MIALDDLESRSVLILGLGREGMNTLSFLRGRLPARPLGLADRLSWEELGQSTRDTIRADGHLELFLGADYLRSVSRYDVLFKSPGISPLLPEIAEALRQGKLFSSNTELFFRYAPGPIVGVTGTKGKSTTTSMIHQVLMAGGIDARLTGNIGIPPLSCLEGADSSTVFVAELSSHQLMMLDVSPRFAVLQNVVPEHLDYYGSFEDYVHAKENIVRYQGERDYVVFNASYPIPTRMAGMSRGTRVPFGAVPAGVMGCFVENGFLVFRSETGDERIVATGRVPLRGEFNLQNVMPAVAVGRILGVAPEAIADGIRAFRPLAHRLEQVGDCGGVEFYNDSLATIPQAAVAAMRSFPDRGIVLIAGGTDRGQDFAVLAQAILAASVRGLVLFPPTGERIWQDLIRESGGQADLPQHATVATMREAVQQAHRMARGGDVVLMSPAAASFSVFRDYRDRGDQFKAEVARLMSEPPGRIP